MKVLFVDDNLAAMKVHVLELKQLSAEVHNCSSPDRAEDLFTIDIHSWSGAVIDLTLPRGLKGIVPADEDIETSGYWLVLRLRTYRPEMPVVILTNVRSHPILTTLERLSHVKIMLKKDYFADIFAREVVQFFNSFGCDSFHATT